MTAHPVLFITAALGLLIALALGFFWLGKGRHQARQDTRDVKPGLAVVSEPQQKLPETPSERRFSSQDIATLMHRSNLAQAWRAQGKHAGAEQEHRAVLPVSERVLGSEHPNPLTSRSNLAIMLLDQGKPAGAEQEHRAVLALRERVLGAKHPAVFQSCYTLALALRAQGKLAEALPFARRARDGRQEVLGAEHPDFKDARELCEEIEEDWAERGGR